MNNLNSILVEGNLVRGPQLRTTPRGTSVCNLSMATNRYYQGQNGIERECSYFDIEVWGKLAETCGISAHKGRGIRVVGRLRQDRWNDGESKPHSKVVIVAEHIEFRPELKQEKMEEAPEEMNYVEYPDALAADEAVSVVSVEVPATV